MNVTIAGIDFAHHHYDERGDVLYLNTASYDGAKRPFKALPTSEGHSVEYDEQGRVVSLLLVNVRWLLERDGEVTISWPAGHLSAEDLSAVLQPTA